MNIEKVRNYNQKLLAAFGTILVLLALLALVSGIFIAITELTRYTYYNDNEEGILSDEKIEELQQENKREQLISFEMPALIDTLNSIYIIPVSHKNLNGAEYIDDAVLGLMSTSSNIKTDKRYSSQRYGDFNNLLIYNIKEDTITKLFKERVNFGNIQTEYFNDEIILLIKASNNDTYKDGVVNLEDLKTLFIYSFKNKSFKEIRIDNTDVLKVEFTEDSQNLLIKFGVDKNSDGRYTKYYEPTIIKKYNLKTGELTNIVDNKLRDKLQKKLEGTKE